MDLTRIAAVAYFVGALLVSVGVGFFDWRLGLIAVGAFLLYPSLTLGASE